MNRETRRALEKAGVPMPGTPAQSRPAGPDPVTLALVNAASSDCTCVPCKLLRKAAKELAAVALEDDDGEPGS